jgi:selenium-binding protein 1
MHHSHEGHHNNYASCGPGYPSLKEAMEKAEREKVLYTMALYAGTDVEEPDYLATVDRGPES